MPAHQSRSSLSSGLELRRRPVALCNRQRRRAARLRSRGQGAIDGRWRQRGSNPACIIASDRRWGFRWCPPVRHNESRFAGLEGHRSHQRSSLLCARREAKDRRAVALPRCSLPTAIRSRVKRQIRSGADQKAADRVPGARTFERRHGMASVGQHQVIPIRRRRHRRGNLAASATRVVASGCRAVVVITGAPRSRAQSGVKTT